MELAVRVGGPARTARCRGRSADHVRGRASLLPRPEMLPLPSSRRRGLSCAASHHHREGDHTTLRAQRGWLQRQRVLRHDVRPGAEDVLELNVAGRLLVTQRSTLMQVHGSRLRHMFDPLRDGLLPRDSKGTIFLDYDPDGFTALLKYLRELRAAGGTAAAVPLPDLQRAEMAVVRYLLETPTAHRSSPPPLVNPHSSRPAPVVAAAAVMPAAAAPATTGGASGARSHLQRTLQRPMAPPGSPAAAATAPSTQQGSSKSSTGLLTAPSAGSSGTSGPQSDVLCSRLLYVRTSAAPASGGPAAAGNSSSSSSSGPGSAGGGRQNLKVSVLTESDLAVIPGQPSYSIMVDHTQTSSRLSFAFTLRNASSFDNMYVGITTTSQVHQRGLQIPSFGWKQYSSIGGMEDLPAPASGQQRRPRPAAAAARLQGNQAGAGGEVQDAGQQRQQQQQFEEPDRQERWRQQLAQWAAEQQTARPPLDGSKPHSKPPSSASTSGSAPRQRGVGRPWAPAAGKPQEAGVQPQQGLWRVGDHVELTIDQGAFHSLTLRVNGRKVDTLRGLPTSTDWCCYMALFSGMEVGCLVFERDSYSVCGGDYRLTRFLDA